MARDRRVWLLGVLAFGALLYLVLPSLSATPPVRRWVQNIASSASGYETQIGSFRIGYDLSLTFGSLAVSVSGDPPFLDAEKLRVDWLSTSLFSGRIGSVDVNRPRLFVARLPQSGGKSGEVSLPVDRIDLHDARVEYPLNERIAAIGPFNLALDSVRAGESLDLRGRSEIAGGGGTVNWAARLGTDLETVNGHALLRVDELRRLTDVLDRTALPELLGSASGSLTVRFAGSLRRNIEVNVDASLEHPALGAPITAGGEGNIAPQERSASLDLQVHPQPALPPLDLTSRFEYRAETGATVEAEMEWDDVSLQELARSFPAPVEIAGGQLSLQARAHGALASPTLNGTLSIDAAKLQSSSWNAMGTVAVPFRLDDATLHTEGTGLQLMNWKGSVASFDWQLERGTIQGSFGATDGVATAAAENLVAAGLQFHDADHLRAGESVDLRGAVEAQFNGDESLRLEGDLSATGGELLWDRFYMKLASHAPRLQGVIDVAPPRIGFDGTELSMAGIGKITAEGEYDWQSGRRSLQANVDLPGLSALYGVAVRDAFREMYPLLGRTTLKGKASAALDYREDGVGKSLSGNLDLDDVEISASDPALEVKGLNLALPFELGENLPSIEPRTGLLRIADLAIGGVEASNVAIPLTAGTNQFSIANSVRIPLLGGALFLASLDADRLAGPAPRTRFSLRLQEIELGRLSKALGGPSLQGTLTGAIPNVTLESGEVHCEGEIRASLFDGEARIRNLHVSNLFSPVPALELNLDFHDISLGEMTDTFEIGHVSGVVRGGVEDLEIVRGEPVRFEARMETVPRPGVPQRVSVTAIRQLSILGGSGGDPLSSGILSFFDEYRYAKMGFQCSLRNDRFTLHGIEELDGKDYLVVGSIMPPRVNVISHNQTISFSQMIHRIERALATTEKEPSPEPQP